MLFVPGHALDWMLKAPKYGADALIFDLEDAVPLEQKRTARGHVASALDRLKDDPFGRYVRVNGWRTGFAARDVVDIVRPGLDGVMLSKCEDVEDVAALDLLLTDLELDQGMPVGHTEIFPLCETARAFYRHFELCSASERVRRAGYLGNAIQGDVTRALGLQLTTEMGDEALWTNARSGLEARAAGVTQIVGGMTAKIGDLDLVRRLAMRAKSLGANGALAIHPSFVPVLNAVFAPSAGEIDDARGVVDAMEDALARGAAATRFRGEMIDYAHLRVAIDTLTKARSLGIDVGELPDIPILSY